MRHVEVMLSSYRVGIFLKLEVCGMGGSSSYMQVHTVALFTFSLRVRV